MLLSFDDNIFVHDKCALNGDGAKQKAQPITVVVYPWTSQLRGGVEDQRNEIIHFGVERRYSNGFEGHLLIPCHYASPHKGTQPNAKVGFILF